DIAGATALLHWDQETYMPVKGIIHRSRQLATLSTIYHQKLTDKKIKKLLEEAAPKTIEDKALVREFKRGYDKATKLPDRLISEMVEATSVGLEAWKQARAEKKFSLFQKPLERILKLKLEETELVGYKESPYDALLDDYEPDLTAKKVTAIFEPLRAEIVASLPKILKNQKTPAKKYLTGQHFPLDKAKKATETILAKMGYDFEAGRQDLSTHPFTTNFGIKDVRVTNRFDPQNFQSSIYSAVHEGGHGLYEMGISEKLMNTFLAGGTSLGIHESQSRMWENLIGRSLPFWQYWTPYLQGIFHSQLVGATPEKLFKEVNLVKPDFIRVEADEVTYNLHIILRFEIERDLMEGKFLVSDLPEVWNIKFKNMFGLDVPNDSLGVLQDIHWSQGSIGYFPTYTLGNLYSAQFFRQMPNMNNHIASGNFEPILLWLRKNI
ncbi:carboxypeptidase M32, partial [Candidatus Microgenomates bacterium]|nr:carboxypeptidase M32 [Candidatus Microgenomates bacterium]